MMQSRVDLFEAAGYLGMTVDTLLEVYGHHLTRTFKRMPLAQAAGAADKNVSSHVG